LRQEYASKVPLQVEPKPTYEHRFFMLWKRYDIEEELEELHEVEKFEFRKWTDVDNDSYRAVWFSDCHTFK